MVGSLDMHTLTRRSEFRPRRFCLRRELPEPGERNFACGANYPQAPAREGGLFCIVWSTNRLDLTTAEPRRPMTTSTRHFGARRYATKRVEGRLLLPFSVSRQPPLFASR